MEFSNQAKNGGLLQSAQAFRVDSMMRCNAWGAWRTRRHQRFPQKPFVSRPLRRIEKTVAYVSDGSCKLMTDASGSAFQYLPSPSSLRRVLSKHGIEKSPLAAKGRRRCEAGNNRILIE
jgi:hypothetical protein